MRKALAVLDNSVSNMTAFLSENDDKAFGFTIIPAAVPNVEFDVFTVEAMEACGFEEDDSLVPCGFVQIDEKYMQYLNKLQDEGKDHPLNVDKLPWNGQSGYVMHMPTLEECKHEQD